MHCAKLFLGITVLSLYRTLGPVQSENCMAPADFEVFPWSDELALLFFKGDGHSLDICNQSLCDGHLQFGVRSSCWTEDEIQSAITSTNTSNPLPNKWSHWDKSHLQNTKSHDCLPIRQVRSPLHQYCLYQWYAGPAKTFAKKASTSERVLYKYRGQQVKFKVQILGSNRGMRHFVKANTSFSLTCRAMGVPKPHTGWHLPLPPQDGIKVDTTVLHFDSVQDGNKVDTTVLHFDSVQARHAGHYTCWGSQRKLAVKYDFEQQYAYVQLTQQRYDLYDEVKIRVDN